MFLESTVIGVHLPCTRESCFDYEPEIPPPKDSPAHCKAPDFDRIAHVGLDHLRYQPLYGDDAVMEPVAKQRAGYTYHERSLQNIERNHVCLSDPESEGLEDAHWRFGIAVGESRKVLAAVQGAVELKGTESDLKLDPSF